MARRARQLPIKFLVLDFVKKLKFNFQIQIFASEACQMAPGTPECPISINCQNSRLLFNSLVYYFLSSLELAQRIEDNCQLGQKSKIMCCVSVELYRFRRLIRHGCLQYEGRRQDGQKDPF